MVQDMTYDRADNRAAMEMFFLSQNGNIFLQQSLASAIHITYHVSMLQW